MPDRPSQAEFAQLVGFSKNTVARYERDEHGADKQIVILRWAEVSGFDPNWLWQGDDPPDGDIAPVTLWMPEDWLDLVA
jgi:transcriptional regulator with XRE-family HTH domain